MANRIFFKNFPELAEVEIIEVSSDLLIPDCDPKAIAMLIYANVTAKSTMEIKKKLAQRLDIPLAKFDTIWGSVMKEIIFDKEK